MATHPRLRLGLLGGECTGKSALAERIQAETGAHVVGEYLRAFVEREGRAPTHGEQAEIFVAQREVDLHTCPTSIHIADPIPGMTAVYSAVYFDDLSLMADAVEDARRYDLLAWCDMDIPWEPDGSQRDGPGFRLAAHTILANHLVPRIRETGIDVVEVAGSVDERWDALRGHLAEAWQPH